MAISFRLLSVAFVCASRKANSAREAAKPVGGWKNQSHFHLTIKICENPTKHMRGHRIAPYPSPQLISRSDKPNGAG